MKFKLYLLLMLLALIANPGTAMAQGTAFTYQGRLNNGANAANGSYDLAFSMFNVSTGGSQVGGTVTNSSTAVSNGLFAVLLDFGTVFNGTNYCLEIAVRTNGPGSFTTLSPRQQLTPTPYAIYSANAGSATTATVANSANSVSAANIAGTISDARLSANVALLNGSNTFTGPNSFIGGNVGIGTANPTTKFEVRSQEPFFAANTDFAQGISGSGFYFTMGAASGNTYTELAPFTAGNVAYGNLVIPGGNVGIGKTNPATALDVNGTVTATSFSGSGAGLTSLNAVAKSGDTMTGALNLPGNGLVAGGNQLVLANGSVGIGTTTPTDLLHLYKASDHQLAIDASGQFSTIDFKNNNVQKAQIYWDNTGNTINIQGGTLAFAPAGGNVGIGTTNPVLGKLEVYQSSDANLTSAILNDSLGTSAASRFMAHNGGSAFALEKYGVGYSGTGARRSGFGGLNDSGEGINITAAGSSGIIGFYSGGMTAGEERMRILANGSVGIGTATPGDSSVTGFGYNYQPALHVNGPGGTALTISGGSYAELDLVHSGGTANAKGMFLRQANQKLEFSSINDDGNYKKQAVLLVDGNTGNIGIGTTGPQTRLDIAGSGLTFRVQNDTDNAEAVVIQAGINAGSTNVTSLGALDLWDSAGAGTAGISFNNINHGTHIADIALNTRGAGVALMVKNSGNVGIGTSNPATTLDVNGSATIRGPLTITSPVNWVASGMNPVNLIVNGGFENWTAGASALPDGWTYYSPAVSVAREGTIKKMGAYSLKVTRAGSDVGIYNEIDQEFGMGYWTGRTVTFSAWVYATVPSAARLSFLGESGASSYHTGDGTWQLLSFTKTVTSTSYVAPLLQVNNNDTAVYFDGVTAVEGSTPFAFSEKPLIAGINAGTAPLSFAGKVGIGTTNPNWSLTDGGGHIALDPSVVENTDKSGNTDFQSSGIGWKAASGPVLGALINTASNGNWGSDLHFSVRNANGGNFPSTSAMVIKSGGNVGIGRTNPATALDVNGTVTAASFSGSGAGLTSLNAVAKTGDTMTGPLNLPANGLTAGGNELVLAGGNVGIGTNNPQSTLHVNGTVTANGIIKALGGLVIENRTSDPASPATGQIWLRTDLP